MSARIRLLAMVAASVLAAFPAAARADGDPASDVLLSQDVFFPYAPKTSPRMGQALTALLQRTSAGGYPMKVALIGSAGDLGANADLFGQDQSYADLLSQELRTLRHGQPGGDDLHLLVVMPSGFSGVGLGDHVDQALASVRIDAAAQSDGLARAAIEAVARVASSNGHETPIPPEAELAVAPSHQSTRRSGPSVLPFAVPLAGVLLVLIATSVSAARSRRRSDTAP